MSETHVPDEHGSSKAVEGEHGATADHGDGHGHDDHGHPSEALGPIDWAMWGAGVVGLILGLLMTAGLVAGTSFSFSA